MPPRSKAAKPRDKPTDDTVFVAMEAAPTPVTLRKRAKAAAAANQRRTDGSDDSSGSIVVATSEEEPAPVVPPKAPSRRAKASKTAPAAATTPGAAGEPKANVDLAPAKQAVDSISDSFRLSAQLSRRLSGSGSLAPTILHVVLAGAVSEASAVAGRFLLGRVLANWPASWAAPAAASWYPSAWHTWSEFVHTTAPPGAELLVSGLAVRSAKQVLTWSSRSRTVALAFLTYAPMVYLLSSFYNVPLPVALLLEGLNFAADLTPLLLHHGVHGHLDAVRGFAAALRRDAGTFALTSLFAAVLYGFTLAQASRLFLPATLVVHFANIATVVPARLAAPTLRHAYAVIYMGAPALVLTTVCGVAARIFLFGVGPPAVPSGSSETTYAKTVAVRTGRLLLTVGLSVFAQCYWGIPGVSAVGAGRFSSIWATAVLLVGASLGFVGA